MNIYFGDICIPWVVDKDTSIAKDTVEKNFVDKPPQVYELTPDLEAGTYTAVLNETVHDKDESFEEQQDAVLSMVSRHGTEFPFSVAGDSGYAIVNNASTSVTPREEIEEAEIDLRYLDNDIYQSAVKVTPQKPRDGDFDITPGETLVAFPSFVDVINKTADFTISTENTDLDLYIVDSSTVYEYNEDSTDMSKSQRESICRLYDSNDLRLYSDSKVVDNGSHINNSLVRVDYDNSSSTIEYYDSGWNSLIDVQLSFDDGYASENTNDEVTVSFVNGYKSSVYRGFPVVEYTFSGKTEFRFQTDSVVADPQTFYYEIEHRSGYDLLVIKESDDNSWQFIDSGTVDYSVFGINGLDSSKEYTVYLGVIPSSINNSDYRRYVYNLGKRRRTFVQ